MIMGYTLNGYGATREQCLQSDDAQQIIVGCIKDEDADKAFPVDIETVYITKCKALCTDSIFYLVNFPKMENIGLLTRNVEDAIKLAEKRCQLSNDD